MKKLFLLIILNIVFISNLSAKHCTYDFDEKSLCEKECKAECQPSFNGHTYTCNKC